MPKTSEMRDSKYLKQADVGKGVLVTIERVLQMDVSLDDAPTEMKWCIKFVELDKPMVLNGTNIQLLEKVCGSDDTDHWHGKRVVLYVDPNVSYQGKLVGGIRVRAPKPSAVPPPKPAPLTPEETMATGEIYEDEIPF
jgi:hypothetical protein